MDNQEAGNSCANGERYEALPGLGETAAQKMHKKKQVSKKKHRLVKKKKTYVSKKNKSKETYAKKNCIVSMSLYFLFPTAPAY